MSSFILFRSEDKIERLSPSTYKNETELQNTIKDHPEIMFM